MMKKTKIGAAVMMAAFAMMTVQPMTSMAAGNCQTRICGGSSANLYGTVRGSCGVGNSNFGNCGSQIFGQSGCQTSGNCFGQNAGNCQTGNNCKPGQFQNYGSCGSSVKNWNTGLDNWSTGCRK